MKKFAPIFLASLLIASLVSAGDNLIGTITTTSSNSVCMVLAPKRRYSIQNQSSAFYVAVTNRSDGTGTAAALNRADVTSVYVAQYALYDFDTTETEKNVCIYGLAGAVTAAQVFQRTFAPNN